MENISITNMLQSLSGNPLATPIGQKIEQATDASLPSENWNLNMLICDMINDTDEGPRDAVRAIRRRLQQNAGKNHVSCMHTLTVLETCVKNCGRRFHLLVTNKDFVNELIKLIGPKNEPPLILQTKVLSIIQTWATAFRGIPELSGVVHVYNDLKSKSIEFPPINLDSQVPIHTPQRSVPATQPPNHISIYQHALGINPNQLPQNQLNASNNLVLPSARMAGPILLNEEQLAKLKSELEIVNGNIKVFDEMLSELDKSTNNLQPEDLELLNELNATCVQMQRRIVELLDRISNEEVTNELLAKNDSLNTLFSRYEVYSVRNPRQQSNPNLTTNVQPASNQALNRPKAIAAGNQEASLIDFKDSKENQLANELDQLQLGAVAGQQEQTNFNKQLVSADSKVNQQQPQKPVKQQQSDEFDQFAQLRTEKNQVPKVIDGVELPNEQEVNEMEQWLKEQNSAEQPASLSNTEFDRFLEQRFSNLEKNQPPKKEDKQSGDLLDLN